MLGRFGRSIWMYDGVVGRGGGDVVKETYCAL
jgi:hypothetical protein